MSSVVARGSQGHHAVKLTRSVGLIVALVLTSLVVNGLVILAEVTVHQQAPDLGEMPNVARSSATVAPIR